MEDGKGEIYKCVICEKTFESAGTDTEAREEAKVNFPGLDMAVQAAGEQVLVVCDPCYIPFKKWLDSLSKVERDALDRASQESALTTLADRAPLGQA